MSKIRLNEQTEVDPDEIASVRLEEKGAKISGTAVTVGSGDWQDLRVPEELLVVQMKDGSEFAVRSPDDVKSAWDKLADFKAERHAGFEMTRNPAA